MNLEFYPNDQQICRIEFESYGSSMADIVYSWGKPLGISTDIVIPHYNILGHRTNTNQIELSSGKGPVW